MSWKAVQTLNDASGKPVIKCSGLLEKYVQERQLVAQVSISDEVNMVIAFVILSVHQD
jgi:holo-[acyl-carrier protein] synthase